MHREGLKDWTCKVEALESRVLFSGSAPTANLTIGLSNGLNSIRFVEGSDHKPVTIKFSGAGQALVPLTVDGLGEPSFFHGGEAVNGVVSDIGQITCTRTGVNSKLSFNTTLTHGITTDGSFGSISGTGELGDISIAGSLGRLSLGESRDNTISVGAGGAGRIMVTDCSTDITSAGPINTIFGVANWFRMAISAPRISTLSINDFSGVDVMTQSIRRVIGSDISGGKWTVSGEIGAFRSAVEGNWNLSAGNMKHLIINAAFGAPTVYTLNVGTLGMVKLETVDAGVAPYGISSSLIKDLTAQIGGKRFRLRNATVSSQVAEAFAAQEIPAPPNFYIHLPS